MELCEKMISYYGKYKYDFILLTHRNKKVLIKDNVKTNYSDIPFEKVNKSIRDFHKIIAKSVVNFVSKALKNDGVIEIKRNFQFVRKKNYDKFDSIPIGGSFFNYDFNSSYWQMMYKLGIISEKIYKKYYSFDTFKLHKAICMGLTTSCKRAYYYKNGTPLMIGGNHFFVDEVRTQERILFANVRVLSSNYIAGACQSINNDYVAYTIDSIMCSPVHNKTMKEYFDSLGLDYKVEVCRKISENTYTKRGDEYTFKAEKTTKRAE
jgi:hypothetical protein